MIGNEHISIEERIASLEKHWDFFNETELFHDDPKDFEKLKAHAHYLMDGVDDLVAELTRLRNKVQEFPEIFEAALKDAGAWGYCNCSRCISPRPYGVGKSPSEK
jgi:hypothetical protein